MAKHMTRAIIRDAAIDGLPELDAHVDKLCDAARNYADADDAVVAREARRLLADAAYYLVWNTKELIGRRNRASALKRRMNMNQDNWHPGTDELRALRVVDCIARHLLLHLNENAPPTPEVGEWMGRLCHALTWVPGHQPPTMPEALVVRPYDASVAEAERSKWSVCSTSSGTTMSQIVDTEPSSQDQEPK